MWLAIQAANETNLQGFPVPFIINEELWEWAPSMYQHAVAPIHACITWAPPDPTKPAGVWNFDALRETIRIVCPHCRKATPDDPALRRKMNALGRYRVTNPNAPRNNRSFHWPSWASEK